MQTKEIIEFNGVTFIRFPESKGPSARRYFYPFKNGRRVSGVGALHQAIWKHHNGPIPKGHHVHHKDGNHLNNVIENLECLSPAEHKRKHLGCSPAVRAALDRLRPLASEWHRSEAGRKWHSEHAREIYEKRVPAKCVCIQCGESYESMARRPKPGRNADKFCGKVCQQRWHYKNKTFWVKRPCLFCSIEFLAPPNRPNQCCSHSCATRLWRKAKKDG